MTSAQVRDCRMRRDPDRCDLLVGVYDNAMTQTPLTEQQRLRSGVPELLATSESVPAPSRFHIAKSGTFTLRASLSMPATLPPPGTDC
jgi:hypothetical protein